MSTPCAPTVLAQASAPYAIWDGKTTLSNPNSGNNATGKRIMRICNSYDITGWTAAPPTTYELAQSIIVDAVPVDVTTADTTGSPNYYYYVKYSCFIFADTTAGNIVVAMPPDPYNGMLVVVKAISVANTLDVNANVSQFLEQVGARGNYTNSGDGLTSVGQCVTYRYWKKGAVWLIQSSF